MKFEYISDGSISSFEFFEPTLLSVLLRKCGKGHIMPCGGKGNCKKCLVKVKGELLPPSENEKSLLKEISDPDMRYACMATATGNVTVFHETKSAVILSTDENTKTELSSPFLCIDIGTTTVVGALYDKGGTLIDKKSIINSQTVFGSDIISRLEKAQNGDLSTLSGKICGDIDYIVSALLKAAEIQKNELGICTVSGNTAMLYLLCNKPVSSITVAPFAADCLFGTVLEKGELPIPSLCGTKVFLPPCISSFVGADIFSGLIYVDSMFPKNNYLFVDIGTNSEIVLRINDTFYCTSAPAGPCFEGANISCGQTATAGAVSHVAYSSGKFSYKTVGDCSPTGICGSGIIDLIACLKKSGILNKDGLIEPDGHGLEHYIKYHNGEYCFYLNNDIFISNTDIKNFTVAKSAIFSAIETLARKADINIDSIDTLFIAGGFGNFININNAISIGLFKKSLENKISVVGNTSLMGAALLCDGERRAKAQELLQNCITVNLSTNSYFAERFIENMKY